MSFEKYNVVMLPTKKKESYHKQLCLNGNFLFTARPTYDVGMLMLQNLYITSKKPIECIENANILDKELKKGCLFISDNDIIRCLTFARVKTPGEYYSIISSNDPIINLAQPSPQFIEKFVRKYNEGNPITEVMVEFEEFTSDTLIGLGIDSLIYTLKVNPEDNTITIRKAKESWVRDEVTTLCINAFFAGSKASNINKWLKENL